MISQFSFRSAGRPLVRHETLLAGQLVVRKGNVPPASNKVITQRKHSRPFMMVPQEKRTNPEKLKRGLATPRLEESSEDEEMPRVLKRTRSER